MFDKDAMTEIVRLNQRMDKLLAKVVSLEEAGTKMQLYLDSMHELNEHLDRSKIQTDFKKFCQENNITMCEARGGSNARVLANKRMRISIAMIKEGHTQEAIGKLMNKDHSTIGNHIRKAEI